MHQIVGFEIASDPMLQPQFLPLDPGLTVFYGLNGSGKTRLISGIRDALLGVSSDAGVFLVCKTSPDSWEQDTDPTQRHPQKRVEDRGGNLVGSRSIRFALAEKTSAGAGELETSGVHDNPYHLLSPSQVEQSLQDIFSERLVDESSPLAEEITAEKHVLLRPAGSRSAPVWEAWPAFDSWKPVAAEFTKLYEELVEECEGDYLDDSVLEMVQNSAAFPLAWSDYQTGDGTAFRPTRFGPFDHRESFPEEISGFILTGALDLGLDLVEDSDDPDRDTLAFFDRIVGHVRGKDYRSLRETARTPIEDWRLWAQPRARVARAITEHLSDDAAKIYENGSADAGVELAVSHYSEVLTHLVRRYFADVLPDSRMPRLEVASHHQRFDRPPVRWVFDAGDHDPTRTTHEPVSMPFESMSSAERKWLARAVADALYWVERDVQTGASLRSALTILDEPESALHRSAESRVARTLNQMVKNDPRKIVLAATHSPDLLYLDNTNLFKVGRGNHPASYRSQVQRLSLGDRQALEGLGLNPSDLLQHTKVFLLVEGHHEKLIFDELFGERLRDARVTTIPLGGASRLKNTVDSLVLFEHTRAHVVGLMDNLRSDLILRSWDRAKKLRLTESIEAAVKSIQHDFREMPKSKVSKNNDEFGFMERWLIAALTESLESRLDPHALSRKDILDYLPVKHFVPNAQSWDALWAQHAEARRDRPNTTSGQFKVWVSKLGGSEFNDETILAAVHGLDPVPAEFEQLIKRLEAIASEVA